MDFTTTEKLCLKTLSCFYTIIKFNIMFTKENTLIDPDWFEKHNYRGLVGLWAGESWESTSGRKKTFLLDSIVMKEKYHY